MNYILTPPTNGVGAVIDRPLLKRKSGTADGRCSPLHASRLNALFQRLPPGGGSRRSRVGENALQRVYLKSNLRRLLPSRQAVPPSSRRKANKFSHTFLSIVGAFIEHPRTNDVRPYGALILFRVARTICRAYFPFPLLSSHAEPSSRPKVRQRCL